MREFLVILHNDMIRMVHLDVLQTDSSVILVIIA